MSLARNTLLSRPQWQIINQLTLPLITVVDTKQSVAGLIGVAIPLTIYLDTVYAPKGSRPKARSVEQDQYQIYKTIEGALQTTGIDGKACLLRAICEMQRSTFGKDSLAGEFASLLLTPKSGKGGLTGFLHDYVVAERIGHSMNQSCAESFPRCPTSIFDYFSSEDDDVNTKSSGSVEEPVSAQEHNPAPNADEPDAHVRINSRKTYDSSLKQIDKDVSMWKNPFGVSNHI